MEAYEPNLYRLTHSHLQESRQAARTGGSLELNEPQINPTPT